MNKRFRWGVLPLLMLAILPFGILWAEEGPDDVTIHFVETSDVHGSLFPYDFINDRATDASLAQVSAYVNDLRSQYPVVLLDNGDILQGQPVVYYYNFEKTDTEHVQSSVMNYLQYDAATVGNHDIEAGHPVYDRLVNEFDFPWLAANAVDVQTGDPYFQPYTVLEKGGVKIAILGLITPGIPNWLPEDIWEGMEFHDMIESAQEWVPYILETESPDVLVGLFHSGVDYTYGGKTREDRFNENASALVAELVPGFDLIFTGHDHQDTNTTVVNSEGEAVYIVGAMNAARTVASVQMDLTWDTEEGRYTPHEITAKTVPMDTQEPDSAYLSHFSDSYEEVKSFVSKPIGNFTKTISTREAMFGDSAFVDLIHRIQLEITDADVSFAAPLSFDAQIAQGEVFVRDMFNLYKYENLLYTMELSGQEILDFMEYSYGGWLNTMGSADDHLMLFKLDEDGNPIWNDRYNSYDMAVRYYNYDSAAGIDYTVDVRKPVGERIQIQGFSDGRPFNLSQNYRVAINSYRGNGGGAHLTKGAQIPKDELPSRVLSSTLQDLRFYLMKWIERENTVNPEKLGNWTIVPEKWVERAVEKDFDLLYQD